MPDHSDGAAEVRPELSYKKGPKEYLDAVVASEDRNTGQTRHERGASPARLKSGPEQPRAANRRGRRSSLSDHVPVPDDPRDHGKCNLPNRCSN